MGRSPYQPSSNCSSPYTPANRSYSQSSNSRGSSGYNSNEVDMHRIFVKFVSFSIVIIFVELSKTPDASIQFNFDVIQLNAIQLSLLLLESCSRS